MTKNIIVLFLALFIFISCGKSPEPEVNKSGTGLEEFPDWVIDPKVEGGIAASECIPFSGNISIDKAQISAQGRATLAKQIEVRVSTLDKTYIDRTDAAGKTVAGSSFSSVSKQVADSYLNGTKITKLSRILINGEQNLCGMITLQPKAADDIFNEILKASNRTVSPADEDILYQEFKAHRAQEDLDAELNN